MSDYQSENATLDTEIDETDKAEMDEVEQETEVNLVQMATDVLNALPSPESITPYQLHGVVNTLLEALGAEYQIRPQMMYNYDRNGMIVKGTKDKKRYTAAEVLPFVVKFVGKHAQVSQA